MRTRELVTSYLLGQLPRASTGLGGFSRPEVSCRPSCLVSGPPPPKNRGEKLIMIFRFQNWASWSFSLIDRAGTAFRRGSRSVGRAALWRLETGGDPQFLLGSGAFALVSGLNRVLGCARLPLRGQLLPGTAQAALHGTHRYPDPAGDLPVRHPATAQLPDELVPLVLVHAGSCPHLLGGSACHADQRKSPGRRSRGLPQADPDSGSTGRSALCYSGKQPIWVARLGVPIRYSGWRPADTRRTDHRLATRYVGYVLIGAGIVDSGLMRKFFPDPNATTEN